MSSSSTPISFVAKRFRASDEYATFSVSCGIECPAWHRLLVTNVTFINFDHHKVAALTGLAKGAFTPLGGGWETRFEKIKWVNASRRTYWEHQHEAVYYDLDGSFSGTNISGTSVVPYNNLLPSFKNCKIIPEFNLGIGGRVCLETRFMRVALNNAKPQNALEYKYLKIGYSANNTFVKASDKKYMRQKWRSGDATKSDYLIQLNSVSTNKYIAVPYERAGLWKQAVGIRNKRTFNFVFTLSDNSVKTRTGTLAKNNHEITWDDDYPTWYNCELAPLKCVGNTRYKYPEMKIIYHLKRRTHAKGYVFTIPTKEIYEMRWELAENDRVDPLEFAMGISDLNPGDFAYLRLGYMQSPDHFDVSTSGANSKTHDNNIYNTHTNRSILLDPKQYKTGAWSFDKFEQSNLLLLAAPSDNYFKNNEYEGPPSPSTFTISYKYQPCPKSGCPVPPPSETVNIVRKWSDKRLWNGELGIEVPCDSLNPVTGLPSRGAKIVVPLNLTLILDIDTPILTLMHIFGNVEFENGEATNRSITLHAVNVVVRGTGNLTMKCEYMECHIVMHGDRLTKGVKMGFTDYGSKSLIVFGELNVIGRRRQTQWKKISESAIVGGNHIVTSLGDWKINDVVVLTSSSYDANEAEEFTIAAVECNQTHCGIDTTTSRKYDHLCYASNCPEIAILRHTTYIRGGDIEETSSFFTLHEQEYGAVVVVDKYSAFINGEVQHEIGHINAQYTTFKDCGQAGFDDRACLDIRNLKTPKRSIYLNAITFHYSFNKQIAVTRSSNIILNNIVGYRSLGTMFSILGSGNSVEGCLSVLTVTRLTWRGAELRSNLNNVDYLQYPANFEYANNIMRNNIASGSERLGFKGFTEPCTQNSLGVKFINNEAHSTMHGVNTRGKCSSNCMLYNKLNLWMNWDYGIWANLNCNVIINDVKLSHNGNGMLIGMAEPASASHVVVKKYVKFTNSLVEGWNDGSKCQKFHNRPKQVDKWSRRGNTAIKGMEIPNYSSGINSMIPKKKPWSKVQASYPGLILTNEVINVKFVDFNNICGQSNKVVTTNAATSDGQHPIKFRQISFVNVPMENKVFIHAPSEGWIKLDDCVSMDCDGLKHSIVEDADGSFFGASKGGFILARAEYFSHEFNYKSTWHKRDPKTLPGQLVVKEDGSKFENSELIDHYGIYRPGCVLVPAWNSWKCTNELKYRMMIIESMDGDTEERSLIPVALKHNRTIDLMNGGMDHGWCFGYTCLKRLSTFFSIVATGKEYDLYFGGTNPGSLRYHLLGAGPSEGVVVKVVYTNPQRLVVYTSSEISVGDMNYDGNKHKSTTQPGWVDQLPTVASPHGTNTFVRSTNTLYITIRGGGDGVSQSILIKTIPVVQVSLTMAVNIDDFYDQQDQFVSNIAFVLGIPSSRIRIVNIVAGSVDVDFEIGPPLCEDKILSGNETCPDGGGDCSLKCLSGQGCRIDQDCESRNCNGTHCLPPTFYDGIFNPSIGESDVDCGFGTGEVGHGISLLLCSENRKCNSGQDCKSSVCNKGICLRPSCDDGVLNGNESCADGGFACPKRACQPAEHCTVGLDCFSKICIDGKCIASTTTDGVKNGDSVLNLETDIDCGCNYGCPKCEESKHCNINANCVSDVCQNNTCIAPSCNDNKMNGDESSIDCGGLACNKCNTNDACNSGVDCISGICSANKTCDAPKCDDMVLNQGETAFIEANRACGGDFCEPCPDDYLCEEGKDKGCKSGICKFYLDWTCAVPSCSDGVINGNEADKVINPNASYECGGSCALCPTGAKCNYNDDCTSFLCENNRCVSAGCKDGVINGGETDIQIFRPNSSNFTQECGGLFCPKCNTGQKCLVHTDCVTNSCDNETKKCVANTCVDNLLGPYETDIDCGGTACKGKSRCKDGKQCQDGDDCVSGVCAVSSKVCLPPSDSDGVKNQNESCVDGGKTYAKKCLPSETCAFHEDCFSNVCFNGICQHSTCHDKVKNGDNRLLMESDVDCGNAICEQCTDNKTCFSDSHCISNVCTNNICQKASCNDGKQNGLETSVDCGIDAGCPKCGDGMECKSALDCVSNVCLNSKCQVATCYDNVLNNNEDDVDCGSKCPLQCTVGKKCKTDASCSAGLFCNNTKCTVKPKIDCNGFWSSYSNCTGGKQQRKFTVTTFPANSGQPCPPMSEERSCSVSSNLSSTSSNQNAQSTSTTIALPSPSNEEPTTNKLTTVANKLTDLATTGGLGIDGIEGMKVENPPPPPPETCSDNIKNQDETDVDCAGVCNDKCATGKKCTSAVDCVSKTCILGTCKAPSCFDNILNGDEKCVDGGSSCNNKCPLGTVCTSNSDCVDNVCSNGFCSSGNCADGVLSTGEACVDGGGVCIAKCSTNSSCTFNTDCISGMCANSICIAPSCNDNISNQDETDIDCGGLTCTFDKCQINQTCIQDDDCIGNSTCGGNICMLPPPPPPLIEVTVSPEETQQVLGRGVVHFEKHRYLVMENTTENIVLYIVRSQGTFGTVHVQASVQNVLHDIEFKAGQWKQNLTIPSPTNDNVWQYPLKIFTATLINPSGGVTIHTINGSTEITVIEDDLSPMINLKKPTVYVREAINTRYTPLKLLVQRSQNLFGNIDGKVMFSEQQSIIRLKANTFSILPNVYVHAATLQLVPSNNIDNERNIGYVDLHVALECVNGCNVVGVNETIVKYVFDASKSGKISDATASRKVAASLVLKDENIETWTKNIDKQRKFKLSVLHVVYDSYENEELAKTLFLHRDNADIVTIVSITNSDADTGNTRRRVLLQTSISINFEIGMLTYGTFSQASATTISNTISQSSTIAALASKLGIDATKVTIQNVQVHESSPQSAIKFKHNHGETNSTGYVPLTTYSTFEVFVITAATVATIAVFITCWVARKYIKSREARKGSKKKVTPKTIIVSEKVNAKSTVQNEANSIPTSHNRNFNPSYAALPSTRALKLLDRQNNSPYKLPPLERKSEVPRPPSSGSSTLHGINKMNAKDFEIIKTLHRHDSLLSELTSLDHNERNTDPRFKFKSKYTLPKIEHTFNHVLFERNVSSRRSAANLVDFLNGQHESGDDSDDFDGKVNQGKNKYDINMLKKKPSIHLPPPPVGKLKLSAHNQNRRKSNKMSKEILKGKYYVPARPTMTDREGMLSEAYPSQKIGADADTDKDFDDMNVFVVDTEDW